MVYRWSSKTCLFFPPILKRRDFLENRAAADGLPDFPKEFRSPEQTIDGIPAIETLELVLDQFADQSLADIDRFYGHSIADGERKIQTDYLYGPKPKPRYVTICLSIYLSIYLSINLFI